MLVLDCKITFAFDHGDYTRSTEIDFVTEVEINKSRKNLTDTCIIKLPRKLKILEGGNTNEIFRRGAKVTVSLGYQPEMVLEFTGYIARLDAQIPFTIYCEDEMWHLKQNNFSKAYKHVSLKELVKFVYPGKSRCADMQLGAFVIKSQTTAQVLASLKKYGLRAYFENDGALVVDFSSSLKNGNVEVIYDFHKNVIDDDLVFLSTLDKRIQVRGISRFETGKGIDYITGDKDGDLRTLHYYNTPLKDLKRIVKEELKLLKKDSMKNGITTFGQPYIEPGDVAVLIDHEHLERNGSYLVESVVTTFGVDGFRRRVELERKLA